MKRKILKNLQLLFLCLIVSSCKEQHEYHIIGNLKGIPDGTVIQLGIQFENLGTRIATDTLMNGRFSFSDTVGNNLLRMNLRIEDSKHYSGQCDFWVNNSTIKVTGNNKYLSQWTVSSNIKEQKEENKLLIHIRNIRISIDSLKLLRRQNSSNNIVQQEISYKTDSSYKLLHSKELAYLKNNYNSLISVMELSQIALSANSSQMEIIREIYPKMDTIFSNTLWGEGIKNRLNKVTPPSIGDKFVDFIAKDLQGNTHKLSDYKGKYILLDFGMMYCNGCMESAPKTRRLNEKYKQELYVIGINLDTRKEFWQKATNRDTITWINLSDGKGQFGGAYNIYGIRDLPTYILIDPQGQIVDRWPGSQNDIYFEKLSKYLENKN
jgi:peroxiredoxin